MIPQPKALSITPTCLHIYERKLKIRWWVALVLQEWKNVATYKKVIFVKIMSRYNKSSRNIVNLDGSLRRRKTKRIILKNRQNIIYENNVNS